MASEPISKFAVAKILWKHGRGTPGIIGPIEEGITDDINALAAPPAARVVDEAMVERAVDAFEQAEDAGMSIRASIYAALIEVLEEPPAARPTSGEEATGALSYTPYRVREDMGRADLTILVEEDGDVIVGISRDGFRSEAQFCTPGTGGGRSPLVHAALRNLANAVARQGSTTTTPPPSEGRAVTDAERLDWLETHPHTVQHAINGGPGRAWYSAVALDVQPHDSLREAIDAAFARTEGA